MQVMQVYVISMMIRELVRGHGDCIPVSCPRSRRGCNLPECVKSLSHGEAGSMEKSEQNVGGSTDIYIALPSTCFYAPQLLYCTGTGYLIFVSAMTHVYALYDPCYFQGIFSAKWFDFWTEFLIIKKTSRFIFR